MEHKRWMSLQSMEKKKREEGEEKQLSKRDLTRLPRPQAVSPGMGNMLWRVEKNRKNVEREVGSSK